ncbi:hypothetical protein LQW54_003287 [Pestalotiopsis sp. IQ-011]
MPGTWAKLGHPDLDSVPEDDFAELRGKFLSMIKASVTFDGEPQALDVERGARELVSTQDIELSDWGISLKSTSADGKTLTFKAGSKFHPILVATLGKVVGGH